MRRLAIVVVAYVLSSFGLFVMLGMLFEGLRKAHPSPMEHLITATWVVAWVVHLAMSVAWIRGKRLGKRFSVFAGGLGVVSVLIWPARGLFLTGDLFGSVPGLTMSVVLNLLVMQLVFVLPCVLLAFWLLRYHWKVEATLA